MIRTRAQSASQYHRGFRSAFLPCHLRPLSDQAGRTVIRLFVSVRANHVSPSFSPKPSHVSHIWQKSVRPCNHRLSSNPITSNTHLQHLQLLEALLHQLLRFAPIGLHTGFPERIYCPSPCILAEVVCSELFALAQKRSEERAGLVGRSVGGHRRKICAVCAAIVDVACFSSFLDLSLRKIICRGSTDQETDLVCMPQAGLDVTEDVQICKSGSETRAKHSDHFRATGVATSSTRASRVTVVLSINNFIYQSEEHFSGAGSITAESFIFMYR
jgi:hypothetical protein